jgi:hypothetical protein
MIFLISHFFNLWCNYNNVMAHLIERLLDRSILVPPSRVSNLTPVCERSVLTYSHR